MRELITGILDGNEVKLAELDEHINKLGEYEIDVTDLKDTSAASIHYWIFQGNPKYYDVVGAISNLDTITWAVNQYPKQIKNGDKAYIWLSGSEGGIVAAGTILCNPEDKKDDIDDPYNRVKESTKEAYLGVDIQIERKFINPIVNRTILLADERTKRIGNFNISWRNKFSRYARTFCCH
ncbi:MAG: EVE domain-containing protein [Negativicutes bacterium]